MSSLLSPNKRIFKAYFLAFRVAWSYLVAYYAQKILGKNWYKKRLEKLHHHNALLVKNGFLQLQGLFIKLGQMLSILSNVLPKAFHEPFETLQDKIPARPIDEVKKRVVTTLGKELHELFEHFEEKPIAAASIGQVHLATLKNGKKVVVKVQHIDIEYIARIDLAVIKRLLRLFARFFEVKGLEYLYTQIHQMMEDELDYRKEAKAMQLIRANIKQNTSIYIPHIYTEYITERVLVMEFVEGVKVLELEQLQLWGINPEAIAQQLWQVYAEMIFRDGFYHADPHPGNILVQKDGKIVLLDFGATASLSHAFRLGIPRLIEAAVKNDVEEAVQICYELGFLAENAEAERLAAKMIQLIQKILRQRDTSEALNFKNIEVKEAYSFLKNVGLRDLLGSVQIPKDYVLLNRALTLLLGISYALAPQYNPLDTVRPYAQKYLFESQGGAIGLIKNFIKQNALTAIALPDELRKTLQKVRKGEITVQNPDSIKAAQMLQSAIYAAVYAFLACFFLCLSIYLKSHEMAYNVLSAGVSAFFGLLFLWKIGRRG